MTDAVLLIQHGSVEDPSEIPDFVRTIRRGRPTPQSVIDEVTHRWKAIGGSPLKAITEAQARALGARLGIPVAHGARLWKPWAKDVVRDLVAAGARRVVSLPLAPFSVHVYNAASEEACAAAGATCVPVPAWNEEPALIDAFAEVTGAALGGPSLGAPSLGKSEAHVLFTAHSLPKRVIAMGDPYEGQVHATARLVAAKLGLPRWSVAFQSAGMDGGEWLGPDLPTALDDVRAAGVRDVLVCAIGFLADHTEILFDLDIEARALAEQKGLVLHRAASLNDHPRLIDALEALARRALG